VRASLTFARWRNQSSAWIRNRDRVPSSCLCSKLHVCITIGRQHGILGIDEDDECKEEDKELVLLLQIDVPHVESHTQLT